MSARPKRKMPSVFYGNSEIGDDLDFDPNESIVEESERMEIEKQMERDEEAARGAMTTQLAVVDQWDPEEPQEYSSLNDLLHHPDSKFHLTLDVSFAERGGGKTWAAGYERRDDIPFESVEPWDPKLLALVEKKYKEEPGFFTDHHKRMLFRSGVILKRGGKVSLSKDLKQRRKRVRAAWARSLIPAAA